MERGGTTSSDTGRIFAGPVTPLPVRSRPKEGVLYAEGFPEAAIRRRARTGAADAFPSPDDYGHVLFGADCSGTTDDHLDRLRLVPPVFVPQRLAQLVELGREPVYRDVRLETTIGGFRSALPAYVSAFGSTEAASVALGLAAGRQAGRLGIPMVIGENVMPVNSYGRLEADAERSLLGRIRAYQAEALDGYGGIVVQQSTEDADAEVWNLVYSDPNALPLLESGRLAFELKVGQGAKPGLGGMTLIGAEAAERLADAYLIDPVFGGDRVLRSSSPGTFTKEILRQQIRLMRNNYPRAKVWVKLPPARDVSAAAQVAWAAGADAVSVDGAEAGTGWAPLAFLSQVGLPLGECLLRIGQDRAPSDPSCLLVSGRMWEGARIAKCLALGANAAGLGRAALIAVDTDPDHGLVNLVECLALELQFLVSALGKYHVRALGPEDLWSPTPASSWATGLGSGPA
ncbi:glutamate synthase-related protein [Kribbella sindirgiensis]|uniref:glutamate synthase-related protein n=1 Tax=Kribbella sindirgiensis TaxID=1124744 RepID=UPI001EDE5334|nr:glutamate synthase-related protein [Kribbella sindirgiensis]